MKAVWKFPLKVEDSFFVSMPDGAEILRLEVQHRRPTLWALCDTTAPVVARSFIFVGTGEERPSRYFDGCKFIGTVFMEGGLVWHLFEEAKS